MSNSGMWSDEFMNSMRATGDPLADAVITELFADGDVKQVNSLMRTLTVNEYVEPANLPAIVADYLRQTQALPDHADLDMIKAGENVFWRFGPELILILTCYGLPFCYLGRNGVPVLALTSRLMSNPERRILETAQMVVDVMQAGGLTSNTGRARRTIQKVRLMHAAVRRLAPRSPEWNTAYGVPVNQEDLAGTLMAFSWISLDGLKKLGLELSANDQEGYFHCWRLVGDLLGIKPELIPENMEAAAVLTSTISRREFGPSKYGVEMTAALTKMLADIIPGNIFRQTPKLMIRYFLGEEPAKWLGAEESWWIEAALAPVRWLGSERAEILQDSAAMRKLAQHVGMLIVGSAVLVERAGNRPSFAIPTELKQQWGVNWFN